ncbi:hypothetical protein ZYGR_0C00260 [Zygosaccharomyces rouxii]|uniref:ZYRO0A13442p n=2 Tax=Zygosaccharomyces rouxii TaxID=4956 RepID=C5DP19_ZYGRC|nr:uncharacterized protein ZYRO0A13442g [Zygosaccharomyces rouxii]KAH9198468.1 ceramidase [Zygosaccharomyces rouxii]GAV46984.1 hypothetical protein ZYGR_0C00260 [Zygosaccharomyces rouxii]CAR26010.1 ZYRO0A13442p [Zygosaccharomyces rouxii]
MLGLRKPYPPEPSQGYWGTITSTIDWCEENYVVSPYIAEWSNTITNSCFVLLALYTTYCSIRNGLEFRFHLIGFGFALVGVGSWLFHMTLQYRYQLLDELPMIYATCIPTWSLLCENRDTLQPGSNIRKAPLKRQFNIGLSLTIFVLILTLVYLVTQISEIHQTVYGAFTVIVVILSGKYAHDYVRDDLARKSMYQCMALGMLLFFIGFVSWNMDNQLCSFWIHVRREWLKLPLGMFLELHAWWHLLTAAGVYCYIVFLQYLRIQTQGLSHRYLLIWRWGFVPELIRKNDRVHTKYSLQFAGSCVNANLQYNKGKRF